MPFVQVTHTTFFVSTFFAARIVLDLRHPTVNSELATKSGAEKMTCKCHQREESPSLAVCSDILLPAFGAKTTDRSIENRNTFSIK